MSPEVEAIGRSLEAEAGTYLRNTVREPNATCSVCAAPVDGYPHCVQCNKHAQTGLALADRVGSLIYAVEPDSQAYQVVRSYKAERPGPSHQQVMLGLLALGLKGHFVCAARLSGFDHSGWAVVPSTRGRTKLGDMVRSLAHRGDAEVPVAFVGDASSRELRPRDWSVTADVVVLDHVVLVDDSWVTGAHAQAVAAALKSAGAHQVSIFTVARVLRPDWSANAKFIRERLPGMSFDWRRCPWTAADCP